MAHIKAKKPGIITEGKVMYSQMSVHGGFISSTMSFLGGEWISVLGGGYVHGGKFRQRGVGMSSWVVMSRGWVCPWGEYPPHPQAETWEATRYCRQTGGTHPIGMKVAEFPKARVIHGILLNLPI